MKNSRNLFASVTLSLLLGLSTTAVAQVGTNCDPGQILTPSGSGATAQAPTSGEITAAVPGQIETPPVASNEASLTEIAASVLLGIVSLF